MSRHSTLLIVGLLMLAVQPAHAAISLSFDNSGGIFPALTPATFSVRLDIDALLPNPTNPPDSVVLPLEAFKFTVDAVSSDGGVLSFTNSALGGLFTTGLTSTPGGTSAVFSWSKGAGSGVSGSSQFVLGTFTVVGTSAGNIQLSIREQSAGNNPNPAVGAVTSDFIFGTPSDPIGGDNQLFTVINGGGGGLNSTGTLATITAVPEPSSLALLGLASLAFSSRRRRR